MTQIKTEMQGAGRKVERFPHKAVTDKIIKAFYSVYNGLGPGFLEKVYENALAIELRGCGLRVEQQRPVSVCYHGEVVGEYFADIAINDSIILELKTVERLSENYAAQLINYLRATDFELGLLLNFGPKPQFRRILLTEEYKHRT